MERQLQSLQKMLDTASEFIVNYGFQLLGAVVILILGWFTAAWLGRVIYRLCAKTGMDVTLARFLSSIGKLAVLTFVIIIAMGKFGITIAPFIAALGAIAFGSTLAFQGPLSNYGSGLILIITRPFVVGDTIKVAGVTGIVEEVKLGFTTLTTEDAELITIPNKHIVGEVIQNSYKHLVVETSIGISYASDPDRAIELVQQALAENEAVADNPEPQVGIRKFADSAIEIGLRYWVPTRNYYRVQYQVNRTIFGSFQQAGIIIPFPQRDVHLIQSG